MNFFFLEKEYLSRKLPTSPSFNADNLPLDPDLKSLSNQLPCASCQPCCKKRKNKLCQMIILAIEGGMKEDEKTKWCGHDSHHSSTIPMENMGPL